ncbi:unnamed protein product [Albugo candida]|uniref:Uncharacterized protein n=1 Tax=Albugo candida TaxID=65357 RepID=A0A024G9G6_9STRA|nr:unnamed protein product [Albugo candida]|eukprot:CCI43314.1 unnamed protein product [Albugo candida]
MTENHSSLKTSTISNHPNQQRGRNIPIKEHSKFQLGQEKVMEKHDTLLHPALESRLAGDGYECHENELNTSQNFGHVFVPRFVGRDALIVSQHTIDITEHKESVTGNRSFEESCGRRHISELLGIE